MLVKGSIDITVTISNNPKCYMLQHTFMMIKMKLVYNAILGKPFLHKISILINTVYLAIKFPTNKKMATMRENYI